MARKIGVGGKTVTTEVNDGNFAPLPAGRYEATIFGVKEGEYKSPKNKGLPNLNVQYKISDGQKGANRRVFDLVPLTPTWADGKDAFRFFQFGAAVTGMTEKEFREAAAAASEKKSGSVEIPEDADLLGHAVTITLKVEDDDYRFKQALEKWEALDDPDVPEPILADFQRNSVANVTVAGKGNMGGASAGASESVSGAVQLDAFEL